MNKSIQLLKRSRTPGSICKQRKSSNQSFDNESLVTQTTETKNSRPRSPYGKIVKNSRLKQNDRSVLYSLESIEKTKKIYTQEDMEAPQILCSRKLKLIEDKYNERLTSYHSKKKGIMKEMREVSKSKIKGKIKKGKENTEPKKEHFLLSKLRETVSIIKKTQEVKNDEYFVEDEKISQSIPVKTQMDDFSFEEDIEKQLENEGKKKVKIGIYEKYRDFFISLERMIGFQQRLRKYKLAINCENKSKIVNILKQNYPEKNLSQILKINYEEYELNIDKPENISPQTIAQRIMDLSEECQIFWQNVVRKKLPDFAAKQIFDVLNYDKNKAELDLKAFTRQLNCQIGKNYQAKDLYRIHCRLKPLTKGNFIMYFSL